MNSYDIDPVSATERALEMALIEVERYEDTTIRQATIRLRTIKPSDPVLMPEITVVQFHDGNDWQLARIHWGAVSTDDANEVERYMGAVAQAAQIANEFNSRGVGE